MADPVVVTSNFSNGLNLSEVINVTAVPSETLLSEQNPNNLILLSTETSVKFGADTYRIYKSSTAVADDFASNSMAVKIANVVFSQNKNILSGDGYLVIALMTAAEKLADAVKRTSRLVSYMGILLDKFITVSDVTELGTAIPPEKILFFPQKDPAALVATTGIFDKVKLASISRIRCLFHQSDDALVMQAAYASRAMSVDFDSFNSTQTMQLKSLVGVLPDTSIDTTLYATIKACGADAYVKIEGLPAVMTSGKNKFFDQVHNRAWLITALQTEGFNFFRNTSTKVPQTFPGQVALENAYKSVCEKAVFNGYAAPGEWTSSETFGNPEDFKRNIREQGYFIWMAPITAQSASDREERKAPPTRIAIKEAGAMHSSNVIINLNA